VAFKPSASAVSRPESVTIVSSSSSLSTRYFAYRPNLPLLLPGGGLEATGFIYAVAISASLVDCAPFGTTGATIVASTVEQDRPRVYRNLTLWGLSMVIIGPVVTLATMVVPFLWS